MTDDIESKLIVGLTDKAIIRGGLQLYHYKEAVLLVESCIKSNIQILGIDAFLVRDGYTQPIMEHSIDLSSYDDACRNDKAYQFLMSRKNLDLVYEIVY